MNHQPTLVAIDLGAESCRVSLLQWKKDQPSIMVVQRIPNQPHDSGVAGLRWDFEHICIEIEAGLRACAAQTREPIASIGVTGWAVDYVRLDAAGKPLAPPFCYRDERTNAAAQAVHARIPAADLYAITGTQIQPLNTIYQLYADKTSGMPASTPWVNLPEYVLHRLGAPCVAEYTNATHTGLIDMETGTWSDSIFSILELDRAAAPKLVDTGTILGPMSGEMRELPGFANTQLIAPACHDTASAVSGMPVDSSGTCAYLSSGTWSLMGTLLPNSLRTPEAFSRGFTNLGAAGGGVLFHRGIPGMWLLRQCMNRWDGQRAWSLTELIAAAQNLPAPNDLLDLDDPYFRLPGDMTARINRQRVDHGLQALPDGREAAPCYANLIFHSLAGRYVALLDDLEYLTRRRPQHIYIAGGGSRNEYLNALTEAATGVPVHRCSVESSTMGNFAIQWARLEHACGRLSLSSITAKASALAAAQIHSVS
ncbi:MAG TPA: FGGY family carbohydrate kinase [Acidobacteriaceae bacterium]|nr:FGGY family carbohydrate kinase [Acidobacteriaceae bacterium]